MSQLDKDTRERHKDSLKELKGKKMGEVLDDYFSGKTKLKDAIVLPSKDAAPEEIEAFLKRMDIPKTAEEYKLDAKLIPGKETSEAKTAAAKSMADFFKSISLTKGQAGKVYEKFAGVIKDATEAQAAQQKALADSFEDRLSKDIGDEKQTTETKEYFKRALIALGDKKLVQELKDSGMLYSTSLVRAMADIWKAGNTDAPIPQGRGGVGEKTPDALPKSDQFMQKYGGKK